MKIEPHLESMLPQLELRVLFGPQSGSRLSLSPCEYLLGTDEDCAVMVSGPRMQGIHARLRFDGDRPSIEAVDGSITDAQGRHIEEETPLALGMPVEMGGVWITIDEIDAPWPDMESVIPQPGTHRPATVTADEESESAAKAAPVGSLSSTVEPARDADRQRRRAKLMLMLSATVLLLIALAGIAGTAWLLMQPVDTANSSPVTAAEDPIVTQLKARLAEVAPGRHMSVNPGRDGKPEITGYVSDEAMEITVRDAIRRITNTPVIHLYADRELLAQARKNSQPLQDPTHAIFEVSAVANGVAVLNGSVASPAVRDEIAESLRNSVAGLRGVETSLRLPEDLPPLLQERIVAAGLGKKLQVIEQQPEFVVRGSLNEDELPLWENLLANFSEQFGRLLPIRATIMPVQRTLPVNVQTVIGGPMPFVITDTGQRIGPGGSAGNHTLSSVGDKEVIFDGKQRIRIPR